MPEPNEDMHATVPEQPEAKAPVRKTMPVIIALVVIMALIGIANLSSLLRGNKTVAPTGTVPVTRPAAPDAHEVASFENQQRLQAQRDAEESQHQQEIAAAMQQLDATQGIPGPEEAGAPPMTSAAEGGYLRRESERARRHFRYLPGAGRSKAARASQRKATSGCPRQRNGCP